MKKNDSRFSFVGYILFLLPLSLTVIFGVIIYQALLQKFNNNWVTLFFMFLYIIMVSLIFSLIDIYRRRQMIDKPVEQILNATERIASGDFNIVLTPTHTFNKFDQYDVIMENINKMVKELSRSKMLNNDFIANVSHELKTPFSVIQNYAKALKSEKVDEKLKQKYLQSLILATEKLSNLVTNILKLNKLENQIIFKKYENINVGELLRESILQFEDALNEKEIKLNCKISDMECEADQSYLEIIFNNLISNAIKFSNHGGEIEISLKLLGQHYEFLVKDYGMGINPEVGKRIFEKFYQGDTSHSGEGNGLGLALVKKIIDILGGEISVESEEGKGSTFIVKLKKEGREN